MTTEATTQKSTARSKRRGVVLLGLALGATLSAAVALAATAPRAAAAFTQKIVFSSNRTTGSGVDNPTGDYEVFKMNPDGTGVRQLTFNQVDEEYPTLSPNGKKIAYKSEGIQTTNPEGDEEVYTMNALDGSGKKNLSNNGGSVRDYYGDFSPDSTKVSYRSEGIQTSNPEGDVEVYR